MEAPEQQSLKEIIDSLISKGADSSFKLYFEPYLSTNSVDICFLFWNAAFKSLESVKKNLDEGNKISLELENELNDKLKFLYSGSENLTKEFLNDGDASKYIDDLDNIIRECMDQSNLIFLFLFVLLFNF
jgi:hypothetical protein